MRNLDRVEVGGGNICHRKAEPTVARRDGVSGRCGYPRIPLNTLNTGCSGDGGVVQVDPFRIVDRPSSDNCASLVVDGHACTESQVAVPVDAVAVREVLVELRRVLDLG